MTKKQSTVTLQRTLALITILLFLVWLTGCAAGANQLKGTSNEADNVATLNGTIGSNITLRAMGGLWVVKSSSGVTVT